MKKSILLAFCFFFAIVNSTQAQDKSTTKILLIPLDDRPPCLQFPVNMALIGDVELITPPHELLGRFLQFGKSEEIIKWISAQNLKSFDAAIISVDMLAYGGLVASRVNETTTFDAMKRVEIVRKLRKKAPKIKIYGSSVIMRLAPTGDGKNEAYREKLSKWAEISVDETLQQVTRQLESEIPTEALVNYKRARERDLKINLYTVELTRDKVFDYLILSQDDAKPKGIHVKDRETLISYVNSTKLDAQIAVQPGADEVSMLLLARAMSDKYNYHPKIKAIYSSETMANQAMPFEDRPLRKTVSFHLKAVGANEVEDKSQADILFYVFSSRHEQGRAKTFSDEIIAASQNKAALIVADVDPKGDVQGGDITFTEALKAQSVFSHIYGYACWNTAGNTIGTALPHGMLSGVSKVVAKDNSKPTAINRMKQAQTWFTLNRLLDDYTYHSIVRPKAIKMVRENQWNAYHLTNEQTRTIEDYCLKELQPIAAQVVEMFDNKKLHSISNLTFDLPWNRTFEAEINFKVKH